MGGSTFALLAPCSLRPSGHLRCASSAPPGSSVGLTQDRTDFAITTHRSHHDAPSHPSSENAALRLKLGPCGTMALPNHAAVRQRVVNGKVDLCLARALLATPFGPSAMCFLRPARVFGWLDPRLNRLRHHDASFPSRRAIASIFRERRVAAKAWAMRDDGPPKSRGRALRLVFERLSAFGIRARCLWSKARYRAARLVRQRP
jgi:hypothetical protein